MPYIFKQKLHIQDLAGADKALRRVLIFEPEEYMGALYHSHLRMHNFEVRHCAELNMVVSVAEDFLPNLLVFNIDHPQSTNSKGRWLVNFRQRFPHVCLITTGFNIDVELLKQLMPSGPVSHLNRRLTRPQDLAVLAKTLLNN